MKNLLVILFLAATTSFTAQAGEPVKETSAKGETAASVDFKGTIADVENYKPLSQAEVIISSSDNKVKQTILTDEKGNFSFSDLKPGAYTVQIARKGYETYTRNAVVVENGKMLNLGFSLFRN